MDKTLKAFDELLKILNELREKCPWDRKQTFDSLRTLTIEEVYELSDAIMERDWDKIKKELGDLLLHIVFYAKMADEQGKFNIYDVITALNQKLIYRHPHVFGDTKVSGEKEVLQNWEKLKTKEKGGNKTILGGVPTSLPALIKAYRIQQKVSHIGFDWQKADDVWDKVTEELNELKAELKAGNKEKAQQELGDYLFSLVNAARLYGINPEDALELTNKKFIQRFNYIEQQAAEQGRELDEMSIDELDDLWNKAKKTEENLGK